MCISVRVLLLMILFTRHWDYTYPALPESDVYTFFGGCTTVNIRVGLMLSLSYMADMADDRDLL
jgi:hypothetical protein